MELKNIIYRREDGVARIIKNRPPRNSMNQGLLRELEHCLEDAEQDDRVQVVVIDAHGGDAFHGGADIREMLSAETVSPFLGAAAALLGKPDEA
ncbi:MAG: enoyl-CoA hydratase/isomerase family protein, partial [Dehalococcoidia bacterium]